MNLDMNVVSTSEKLIFKSALYDIITVSSSLCSRIIIVLDSLNLFNLS